MFNFSYGLNQLFRRINSKTLKNTSLQIEFLAYFYIYFFLALNQNIPYLVFIFSVFPLVTMSKGFRLKVKFFCCGIPVPEIERFLEEKNTQKKENDVKKLQEYKKAKGEMELFEHPVSSPYSNSIELYDAIPKYFWGNQNSKRKDGKYLEPLQRNFVFRGQEYIATITPARIECGDGIFRDYYPSQREELLEDALRKLACSGNGCFLDDRAAVTFTLYELREELKARGHGYDITDIKEALFINQDSNMSLETVDGKSIIKSHLFETVGLRTLDDWKGTGEKTQCFVRFNSLVTRCIKDKSFRQLNYFTCMEYQKVLARWLHKRMSHIYIQANWNNPYTILLSTIVRDSGITAQNRLRKNLQQIREALNLMQNKGTVLKYNEEMIYGIPKSKIIDVKFIIFPGSSFTSEMKGANKKMIEILKTAS